MDLKCDICFLNFDLDAHRPKNLPCGHTICQACVENPALGKKCPTCRKAFKIRRLEDLPDSFLAIRMLEDKHAPPCKNPKLEDPELEQLQRGADAGRKMVEMLRLVVPQAVESLNRQLELSVAQLGQVEQALERRVQREAACDVGTTSDAVEEPLQLARQLEAGHRLLTSTKCTVAAEEEGGSSWTASVEPGGCGGILRLVLLQLRADGQLGEVDDAVAIPAIRTPTHLGPPLINVFWITNKHLDNGRLQLDDILRSVREQWTFPRSLRNLHGDGCEDLLRVMGPYLEELQTSSLEDFQPSAMEEVLKMSGLRRLYFRCAKNVDYPDLPLLLEELTVYHMTENQLRCVERMPRLRSLHVLNYHGPNLTFPPSQHGKLLWLQVTINTDYKPTMLSLIRAHASSLQELLVCCSFSPDDQHFYFPDLAQELADCGLVALRRLVLVRLLKNPCTGQSPGCVLQRRTIRSVFPSSVDVVCKSCHTPGF